MNGRGRCCDTILFWRLWHTVKYEEVCLYEQATLREVRQRLHAYRTYYDHQRPHQML